MLIKNSTIIACETISENQTVTSIANVSELCNKEDPPSNKLTQGIYDCFGKKNFTSVNNIVEKHII